MATARLRKAFRFPTESDNSEPAEGIDEEGQFFPLNNVECNKLWHFSLTSSFAYDLYRTRNNHFFTKAA